MTGKGRGGQRPGAGRPKVDRTRVTIRLSPEQHHHLLGKFNDDGVAGAIRQLIQEDMERGNDK